MKYSSCKEINATVRSLVDTGWSATRGSKHIKIYPPGSKRFLTVPGTPSSSSSVRNFQQDVRRAESGMDTNELRRVVLVDLYWSREKDPRIANGHASLLSHLRKVRNLDVHSVVMCVKNLTANGEVNAETVVDKILAKVGNDLDHHRIDVAIGAYIWNEKVVQRVLPLLRACGVKSRIVLGGPQISYVESKLESLYPQADVFIRGAGEDALAELCKTSDPQLILGVHYAGDIDMNSSANSDLQALSSPFLDGTINLEGQNFVRWETQRGCQFKCNFCQHRQKDSRQKTAYFDPERVSKEIELLCASEVNDIAILDPIFNSDEGHAVRILQQFVDYGYKGRLSLQCRAELVTEAFLDCAQKLDVRLEFGLQTIHTNEQKVIKRTNNRKKVEWALAQTLERRIDHEVSLIYGLPEQTLESFQESVAWCLERKVPVIKAFPLLLLRGTELSDERERWSLETDGDEWSRVIKSTTFDIADWQQMKQLADLLAETEKRHPDSLDELLRTLNQEVKLGNAQ